MAKSPHEKLLAEIQKRYPSAVLMGDGAPARVSHVFPTGLQVLDKWVLGYGGLPYGRLLEMSGKESAGKDTLMDRFLAGAQKDGATVALIETEHKWDPDWAKLHGVDIEKLLFYQPEHLEEAQALIELLVEKSNPERRIVIALNSVAATPTKAEVKDGIAGTTALGEQGRAWSKFCRLIVKNLADHQASLILINQIRQKVGVMYGNPDVTPAGMAIKHHSYLRLSVTHGKYEESNTRRLMNVRAIKNQGCPPMRTAELKLDFTTGFMDKWAVLNHAKEMGCVDNKCRSYKEAILALGWEDTSTEVEEVSEEVETTENQDE